MTAAIARRLSALEAAMMRPRRGLAAMSLDQLMDRARRLGLMENDQPNDSPELRRLRAKVRALGVLTHPG